MTRTSSNHTNDIPMDSCRTWASIGILIVDILFISETGQTIFRHSDFFTRNGALSYCIYFIGSIPYMIMHIKYTDCGTLNRMMETRIK